jgi:hypothetical protein
MLIAALPFDIVALLACSLPSPLWKYNDLCWWQAAGEAENLAPKITIFHKNRRKI